jgi:hypothetical protein
MQFHLLFIQSTGGGDFSLTPRPLYPREESPMFPLKGRVGEPQRRWVSPREGLDIFQNNYWPSWDSNFGWLLFVAE